LAATKTISRQARQDRKENYGENVFDLGDLCVFARNQDHPQIEQISQKCHCEEHSDEAISILVMGDCRVSLATT